ncbi:MAG: methionine--tRNA ligase subunit beta [Candidatus Sungbacteria bacterium]|nr:methionine--tRNA ligase subunit beta [Candidatus Sungbacteria bacterium]
MSEISFEEFKKVELRVGMVREAERVLGSEKLLKLSVDLGDSTRQIIAGIGKAYALETLIGREIIIVANLAPRTLMGLESQGMLLCADGELPTLLMPEKEVPPGSSIR